MSAIEADQELMDAADGGRAADVSELLARGADPRSQDSMPLRAAAFNGHGECVRLLLPVSDPQARESNALRVAAKNGHEECVRLLLPASNPKANESEALRWAATNGHVECVRLLLLVSEPKANGSKALGFAAQRGHVECMRLLLPASNPRAMWSYALRAASENGHAECVKMLIPVSDAKAQESEALRWAAYNGHEECVRLLLPASGSKAKADALKFAAHEGHVECMRLLLQASKQLCDFDDVSEKEMAARNATSADALIGQKRWRLDKAKVLKHLAAAREKCMRLILPESKETEALRWAALNGHEECARMLLASSRPLIQINKVLEDVIKQGRFEMAAVLIGQEPRLLARMDLRKCIEVALESGQGDLAAYLSSLIDKKELLAELGHKQLRPARRRGSARL